MYPGKYAIERADQPAFIMAGTGESVTYAEYEARTNQLAHLLRAHGLQRLDHYSIFMENNDRYLEACSAGERAGLYYTCVNSYLTADEPLPSAIAQVAWNPKDEYASLLQPEFVTECDCRSEAGVATGTCRFEETG